jgi:hypothetical protein
MRRFSLSFQPAMQFRLQAMWPHISCFISPSLCPLQLHSVLLQAYRSCNSFYPYRNLAVSKAKYGGGGPYRVHTPCTASLTDGDVLQYPDASVRSVELSCKQLDSVGIR